MINPHNKIVRRIILGSLILAGLFISTSCKKESRYAVRVYLTTGGSYLSELTQEVTMPISKIKYTIYSNPMLTETALTNVELVQVSLGKALMLQYDLMGARELYRRTTAHQGESMIIVLNGRPIGARKIDEIIESGVLISFVELVPAQLDELVINLKKDIVRVNKTR